LVLLDLIRIILSFHFSLNKKRCVASSFLRWGIIIFQKLIQKVITDPNFELFILKIGLLSSGFFYLLDVRFYLLWKQRIHNLPKKFPLWKLLIFPIWIWEIFKSLRAIFCHHGITIWDGQFFPLRDFLSCDVFLKEHFLALMKNILYMR
jgi:hypothetical protein